MSQKVVLVTGGSSGIGEASAVEFAKLGYKVAITGRDTDRLNKVYEDLIRESPSKSAEYALAIEADFEKPEQVDQVVEKTLARFGQLDILINNAGTPRKKRGLKDPDFFEDFQKVLQVNLVAATRVAQLASPYIIKTKGVIINVASIADRLANPSISYSVSKAGLAMLTKTLANSLDGTGVRVITVSPGPIKTLFNPHTEKYAPFTSMNRVGSASEVANIILFLASDKASFVHGCEIDVDGGMLAKFGGIFSQSKQADQQQQQK